MRRLISGLRHKSEIYHMHVHIVLGLLCGLLIWHILPGNSALKLMSIGVIGGILPDFDHILFLFLYGRKTEYARLFKGILRKYQLKNALSFLRDNHKLNTAIYSHNKLSVIMAFSLFYYLYSVKDNASMSVFFLSWFIHYTFDIFEDVLFFKKVNPNWLLKFSKTIREDLVKLYERDK